MRILIAGEIPFIDEVERLCRRAAHNVRVYLVEDFLGAMEAEIDVAHLADVEIAIELHNESAATKQELLTALGYAPGEIDGYYGVKTAAAVKEFQRATGGLEVDGDYSAEDAETMGTRVMVHGDQCVMLEDRRSAAGYLRQMADAAPEATEALQAAAALYEQVAALGSEIWPWGCEDGAGAAKGLSDPLTRRTIAGAVRLAGEQETEAVAHLEAALAAMEPPQ